ncbi:MAG TPA: metalloregulator ArsR/SmtB family transcription factor [Bacteroidota bacterium]|nr:metalloregulator ArsR/SmtB family transcription factor [Bacteroidota bacterium]
MPTTKTLLFRAKDRKLAAIARALAHPARIAILKTLARRDECICGEIVDVLPLAQATVSQHLKELKSLGLIKGQVDGPRSCYCIDRDALNEIADDFKSLFSELQ